MSAITSSANGTYTDCGLGQGVGLTITCGGSSCGILAQFPHLVCSHDPISSSLNCNNGVTCPGTPNFQSLFQMQQHPDNSVSAQQLLQIDGQKFQGTDDGHGVVNYGPLMNANPPSGTSIAPAGTTAVGGTSAGLGPGSASGRTAAGTSLANSQTLLVSPAAGTGTTLSPSGSPTGTAATSNTRAPSLSVFASLASTRGPSLSRVLFVLFVVLAMFIGQSTADSTFRTRNTALSTGISLFWLLVVVPLGTYAQCATVGVVPVSPLFRMRLIF